MNTFFEDTNLLYDEAIEYYRFTINNQISTFNLVLMSIAIFVAIAVVFNWLITYKLFYKKIQNQFNDTLALLKKEIEEKIGLIDSEYKKKFNVLNNAQGDISKIYAIRCAENKSYESAFNHSLLSLLSYKQASDDPNIRTMTDFINQVLSESWDKTSLKENKDYYITKLNEVIPDILSNEKRTIIELLKGL